jgi:hypothetical protein
MSRYGKALAAVVFAFLTALYSGLSGDDILEASEWVNIGIAAATAVGVYLVPLDPKFRWGKTAVGVILSVLQVMYTVVIGGLDSNEWIMLALAALTALGVGVAPARSDNGVSARGVAADALRRPGVTG